MFSIIVTITLVLFATLAGWWFWRTLLPALPRGVELHSIEIVDKQIRYQSLFFLVALCVSFIAAFVSHNDSAQTFALGDIGAGVEFEVVLLLAFGGGAVLFAFPSWRLAMSALRVFKHYPVAIVALAATNALSEELIYRGALINGTLNVLTTWQVAGLSALLFSVAHVRGQASGWFVIFGSAVVGWFLAKSVMESHGLFWAWGVHFTQDIVIFTAFVKSVADTSLKPA